MIPILAEVGGKVRFDEIVEGETLAQGTRRAVVPNATSSWNTRATCTRRSSSRTTGGKAWPPTTCRKRLTWKFGEGQKVTAGLLLAKTPREVTGTQDITGGLPRVTEIFEARRPRDPAVMAEVAGFVRLGERKRGKREILVQPVDEENRASRG